MPKELARVILISLPEEFLKELGDIVVGYALPLLIVQRLKAIDPLLLFDEHRCDVVAQRVGISDICDLMRHGYGFFTKLERARLDFVVTGSHDQAVGEFDWRLTPRRVLTSDFDVTLWRPATDDEDEEVNVGQRSIDLKLYPNAWSKLPPVKEPTVMEYSYRGDGCDNPVTRRICDALQGADDCWDQGVVFRALPGHYIDSTTVTTLNWNSRLISRHTHLEPLESPFTVITCLADPKTPLKIALI